MEAPEPDNVGWVAEVSGRAIVMRDLNSDAFEVEEAKKGTPVYLGDEIRTFTDSNLTVHFEDDSLLTLSNDTSVRISEWVYDKEKKENRSYFELFNGHVRGLLKTLFGWSSEMKVKTPTSIVGVKGSDFSVWIENGRTFAAVTEGEGFIKHVDKRFPAVVKIKPGQMISAAAGLVIKKSVPIPRHIKDKINKLRVIRHKKLLEKFLKERPKVKKKREELKKRPEIKIKPFPGVKKKKKGKGRQ